MKRRQLISGDEATPAKGQHRSPCSDCPWSRKSLAGWTGSQTPDEWVAEAHGEARIECHTMSGAQCAGAAIYRANVCKLPRDRALLQLPKDRVNVFSTPIEFKGHHAKD